MTDTPRHTVRSVLREVAGARVAKLQALVLADTSDAVATLARLRRCDPAAVGAEPLVWAITLGDLPVELTEYSGGRPNEPTPAERSLHATLVMYAFHQQSQDEGVHRPGVSVGAAVGRLARSRGGSDEPDPGTIARLHQAALANDFDGQTHHLRGLMQLMRAERPAIGLDYGLLAVDLWQFADPFQDSRQVLARWGRDLHARTKPTTPATPTPNPTASEETK